MKPYTLPAQALRSPRRTDLLEEDLRRPGLC